MELIRKYIGNWGRYQGYIYALLVMPFVISGIEVMVFSFTGGVPNARCFLPDLDNSTSPEYNSSDLHNMWRGTDGFTKLYSEPKINGGKENYCHYCPSAAKALVNGPESSSDVLKGFPKCLYNETIACKHGIIYDKSQFQTTLVAQLDLVCHNDWKRSMARSFYMVGFLIGAAVSGALSDWFGRRPVFIGLSLLGIITYHTIIFVPNFPLLCVFHILNGAFAHGAYITAFVIVMEYTGGAAATVCGVWTHGSFALGYIYVGLCAWVIRDWKWLQFAVSIPSVTLIGICILIPESIRWLIVHGKYNSAKEIVMKAAKVNKIDVDEAKLECDIANVKEERQANLIDLFRDRDQAKVTIIVFYSWFATSMTYYGLAFNSGELPGSYYVNYLLLGLVEFPGYAISIPMMEKLGRRPSMSIFFIFGGLCIIISTFLPKSWSIPIVILALLGKMGAAGSFAVIYNYSAELFPTVARNTGIGFASSCARIASISAPQIYLLGQYTTRWTPFLIYGLVGISAGIVDLMLPETKGCRLPETLEDGIAIAKGKWKPEGSLNQIPTVGSTQKIKPLTSGKETTF